MTRGRGFLLQSVSAHIRDQLSAGCVEPLDNASLGSTKMKGKLSPNGHSKGGYSVLPDIPSVLASRKGLISHRSSTQHILTSPVTGLPEREQGVMCAVCRCFRPWLHCL